MTDGITPEDVKGRSETDRLLPLDPVRALKLARNIRHPWYRCQALASVAAATSLVGPRSALLGEALAAAREQAEPNRIVSVACWPLRHLVTGNDPKAGAVVEGLLDTIAGEPHGLRKLDGLARLFGVVMSSPALRALVLTPLEDAAAASHGWRTERIVASTASSLAAHDRAAASRLLDSRQPNRFSNQARASLTGAAAGQEN